MQNFATSSATKVTHPRGVARNARQFMHRREIDLIAELRAAAERCNVSREALGWLYLREQAISRLYIQRPVDGTNCYRVGNDPADLVPIQLRGKGVEPLLYLLQHPWEETPLELLVHGEVDARVLRQNIVRVLQKLSQVAPSFDCLTDRICEAHAGTRLMYERAVWCPAIEIV